MHLRLAHSPDPDDVFMWWPLMAIDGAPPAIDTGRFTFEAVLADIESLNRRAAGPGDLEITAMSCAQYPHVQERYAITACGASMGDAYGPKIVGRERVPIQALSDGRVIAVPGQRTSAFGVLSLMLGPGSFAFEVVPFEDIIDRVADGTFDAGLVIHEGQLTYEDAGLVLIDDVGRWWSAGHDGLPLPLGVNAIRRDLDLLGGSGTIAEITALLKCSVEHALVHRDESIRHALAYARGMGADLADEFVAMYVNAWTLDFGARGSTAVRRFLDELCAAGLVPPVRALAFAGDEQAAADSSGG